MDAVADIDDAIFLWYKLFNEFAEQHAPTKTRRIRDSPMPWMTSDLSKLMKDRDYHHRKARSSRPEYLWKTFRHSNRKVHREIKKLNLNTISN